MADQTVVDLIRRADGLKADKSSLESTCDEIRDYIVPWQATITGLDSPNSTNRDLVVDNTGETMSEMFAGAIHGHLTNPGDRWFMLAIDGMQNDHAVQLWLEQAEDAMFALFDDPDSRFYTDQLTSYHSLGDYGTSALYMPARPGRVPLFQSVPFRELLLESDGEGGIGVVCRRWSMAARHAVRLFRDKAGPKAVSMAADSKKAGEKVEILHWVERREGRDPSRRDRTNMPFASHFINVTEKHLIDEGGFEESPYAVDRWLVRDGEVFGRGCGHKALADVKMLQRMSRAQVRGAEKTVNPPLMVPDDDPFNGPVDLRSGAINVARSEFFQGRSGDPIRAVLANARPDIAEDMLAAVRKRLEDAYYRPLILLERDPKMTATQFVGIREQALTILGPFLGRVQNERLAKVIERAFAALWRSGAFPPAPPQISGARMRAVFQSPVVRARRLGDARAIGEMYELMQRPFDRKPELLDNVDEDVFVRIVADRLGVPKSGVRDPKIVADMRQARMEEMQFEQQVDTLERVAPALQSASQAAQGMANDNNISGPGAAANG